MTRLISSIENGRYTTSLDTLLRIPHALDLKLLIGFEQRSPEHESDREVVALKLSAQSETDLPRVIESHYLIARPSIASSSGSAPVIAVWARSWPRSGANLKSRLP